MITTMASHFSIKKTEPKKLYWPLPIYMLFENVNILMLMIFQISLSKFEKWSKKYMSEFYYFLIREHF